MNIFGSLMTIFDQKKFMTIFDQKNLSLSLYYLLPITYYLKIHRFYWYLFPCFIFFGLFCHNKPTHNERTPKTIRRTKASYNL